MPYMAVVLLLLATVYAAAASFRVQSEQTPGTWLFPQGAKRWARITIVLATMLFVGAVGFLLRSRSQQATHGPSTRFLIPDGYTGWIRIEFEVKGAAPLQTEQGETVVTLPASGRLSTSSQAQHDWTNDSFFYVSASSPPRKLPSSGADSLIWGKLNGETTNSSGTHKYEEFFVGTAQQFKDQLNEFNRPTP